MLDARQLASARGFAARLLDLTCTIDRPTNTTGTWGQNSESFTNVSTLTPCAARATSKQMIAPLGGSLAVGAGVVGVIQGYDVWFAVGQNVRENDRITLSSGAVLRVQTVQNQQSGYTFLDSVFATQAQ